MDVADRSNCGVQKALILDQNSSGLVESSDSNESVHNYNSIMITKTLTDSFHLIKGFSVACMIFEKFPVWLLALSPFTFKSICFVQFSSSRPIIETSALSAEIWK